MTIRQLLDFIATLYESQSSTPSSNESYQDIKARLIWRDSNGSVICEKIADIGYSSGLQPYLTIEMPDDSLPKDTK